MFLAMRGEDLSQPPLLYLKILCSHVARNWFALAITWNGA